MIFCSREHCAAEARWVPKVCVPATGYPIAGHTPLSCIIGLPLCGACIDTLGVGDLLGPTPQGGEFREAFAIAAGRVPPDFSRAFMARVSLNSPEYAAFQAGARS